MHTGSHRGALVVDGGLQTAATKHTCVYVMDLLSCADNCFFWGVGPKCHQLFVFTVVGGPPPQRCRQFHSQDSFLRGALGGSQI